MAGQSQQPSPYAQGQSNQSQNQPNQASQAYSNSQTPVQMSQQNSQGSGPNSNQNNPQSQPPTPYQNYTPPAPSFVPNGNWQPPQGWGAMQGYGQVTYGQPNAGTGAGSTATATSTPGQTASAGNGTPPVQSPGPGQAWQPGQNQFTGYDVNQAGQAPAATQMPTITQPGGVNYAPYQFNTQPYNPGQIQQFTHPFAQDNNLTQLASSLAQAGPGGVGAFNPANAASQNGNAQSAFDQAMQYATPNTAGQHEIAKETLLSQKQQQSDQLAQQAALRGTSQGGETAALQSQLGDHFSRNLTEAYRGIDNAAQQQAIQNLLGVGSAQQGLGQTLTGEAQGNYATGLQGTALGGQFQNQQFNQNLGLNQALTQNKQSNYTTGLQGQLAQEGLNQAAAGLGLQGQNAQAGQNLAAAGIGLQNNAQNLQGQGLGLSAAQAQQNANSQSFGNALSGQLGVGNLNLSGQNQNLAQWVAQQQAQQGATGLANNYSLGQGAQALTGQQIGNQNAQYYAGLGQNMNQFNQTMGFNQNNAYWNAIMQSLGLS